MRRTHAASSHTEGPRHPPPGRALNLVVSEDAEAMSRKAAAVVLAALKQRPDLLLCASAGGTPTRIYQLLSEKHRRNPGIFSRMRVLSIDEWLGLDASNPGRCVADLERKLVAPLNISKSRFIAFRSEAPDPEAECVRVAACLRTEGPIDLCFLGLGTNGHMAMIEPAGEFAPGPHVARLAKSSINHPLLNEVHPKPKRGLSIGMGDILRASQALLLVSGAAKRPALERLLTPRVTTRFPASFIWLHAAATVFCDRAACPDF